ncbi:MAG: DUF4173 domain-containing protein [Acidimicrobiia bacterium]|nr:DUF4173 domain-containing protein [Acidimicrobiia bacterium]
MDTKPPPTPRQVAPRPTLPVVSLAWAVLIGFLVQALAFRHAPGFGAAISGLALTLGIRFGPSERSPNRWLIYAAAMFFGALAIRASEVLIALNAMAGLAAVIMATYSTKRPVREWTVSQTILAVLVPPVAAVAYGPTTTFRSLPSHRQSSLGPVLIGLLIGVPILLVFGTLFASADAVFSDLVDRLVALDVIRSVTGHIFWSVALGSLLVGMWMFSSQIKESALGFRAEPAGRSVETTTVLVLLNALFAVFVVIQIGYLFGGVDSNPVTLSEHARQGFFELVAVASLVLGIVLVASWTGHTATHRSAVVNWLSQSLIALTGLVLVSAVRRMLAYWEAFGLTELRLYTTVFMLWIAIALVAMAFSIIRSDTRPFVRVVLCAATVLLLGLTVANPDAIIARTNLGRQAIIQTDVSYLGGLSVDRVPVVAEYVRNHPVECDSPLLTDLRHDLKALDEDESIFSSSWSARQAAATSATLGDCD